ncbi:MAG: tryptophan--tRNA ligase [Candidatus Nanohaloarchaea archaeon]|nr:tryptophan--tRNA ligase [Candidatus Nanohaloarchaea archaeon]
MEDRIDPWGSLQIENYEETMEEFGIQPFEEVADRLPEKNRYIRRNIIYGHRDFDRVLDAIQEGEDWAMMTGLMPSGHFHFGHKMLADQFVWYQEMGAELYIAVADVEAYLTRDMTLEEARELAVEEYLKNYIALGLEPENVNFYFQSEGSTHYNTMSKLFAQNVTQNEVESVYGDLTPGKLVSALTQAADILQPEFEENGGPKPVVVPVGTDQDPHIRLTRDIASRFPGADFMKPSSTYHKFMRGLQGGKMSSSDPNSYISLTEDPDSACEKIDRAKTGGRDTREEQREKGAVIEEDTVFELLAFHLVEDDERLRRIHDEYSSGEMLSGELKQIAKEELREFLEEHQERYGEADGRVEEFLDG